MFVREGLNLMQRIDWCVVMTKMPSSLCPYIRYFDLHSITKATDDLQVVLFDNILAFWCVLVMYHPTGVKENGQRDFDVASHSSCSRE